MAIHVADKNLVFYKVHMYTAIMLVTSEVILSVGMDFMTNLKLIVERDRQTALPIQYVYVI